MEDIVNDNEEEREREDVQHLNCLVNSPLIRTWDLAWTQTSLNYLILKSHLQQSKGFSKSSILIKNETIILILDDGMHGLMSYNNAIKSISTFTEGTLRIIN